MNIDDVFSKKIELEQDFNYEKLFSGTKASAYDKRLRSLLINSIDKKFIQIKKYLVAEDVGEELSEIEDWKVMSHKKIKSMLKDWHSESDYTLSPIIYILEKLEPNFIVELDKENSIYKIKSDKNILIGHRFSVVDAFSRIYLPDKKIIINLSTDSLHNLIDSLSLENLVVYIVDLELVDGEYKRMVAYELIADSRYYECKKKSEDSLMSGIFK
ncbi:hypothetical protein [Clostridium sp. C8-1-8]|uniref:hypothetical protein n=1 Tax=Clostridium sp. C8-1-8 TaxID=2698831 RepID=UPI001368E11D|nr:hypothetical protein [Clostridium sp. C8-1-8]